jgi:hypothetical protein
MRMALRLVIIAASALPAFGFLMVPHSDPPGPTLP